MSNEAISTPGPVIANEPLAVIANDEGVKQSHQDAHIRSGYNYFPTKDWFDSKNTESRNDTFLKKLLFGVQLLINTESRKNNRGFPHFIK